MEKITKKITRRDVQPNLLAKEEFPETETRVFIALESYDGKKVQEKLDVKLNTSIKDIEKITNQLIKSKEYIPLSFYHESS